MKVWSTLHVLIAFSIPNPTDKDAVKHEIPAMFFFVCDFEDLDCLKRDYIFAIEDFNKAH